MGRKPRMELHYIPQKAGDLMIHIEVKPSHFRKLVEKIYETLEMRVSQEEIDLTVKTARLYIDLKEEN